MNIGWEDKELKPFKDQSREIDTKKIGNMSNVVTLETKMIAIEMDCL